MEPIARLPGVAGVTAIADKVFVGTTTVRSTGGLVSPDRVAVILVVPFNSAVAKPA
jgi:hypothetical protein